MLLKKRINEFNELTLNFYFKNATPYPIKCFKENKVKDILNNYASQNSLNIYLPLKHLTNYLNLLCVDHSLYHRNFCMCNIHFLEW